MEINVPGFNGFNINARLPERTKGKNVAVVSQHTTNHNDPHFLSDEFPRNPPKLYVTAESDDFDALTLAEWRAEGFQVEYVAMGNGGDEYVDKLERMAKKNLEPCETFGIVGMSTVTWLKHLCLLVFGLVCNACMCKRICKKSLRVRTKLTMSPSIR